MKKLRRSEILKKKDHDIVLRTMAKNGYKEYSDSFNPFNCLKEPVRFERFKRKYERYLNNERNIDFWFKDICEVYGTVLTRNK